MDSDQLQYENVLKILSEQTAKLSEEDKTLVTKLWTAYYRKRRGISRSDTKTLTAAVLWAYSKINYLWEGDENWSLEGVTGRIGANKKTVGQKTTEINRTLNIKLFDQRFACRKIQEGNPLLNMVMTPQGFITTKDDAINRNIPFRPLAKLK